MFRRKEGDGDANENATATGYQGQPSAAASGSEPVQSAPSQPQSAVSSQPPSSASSYAQAPQMQPVVRSLSDVARPGTASAPAASNVSSSPAGSAGGGYRPAPVADLNRAPQKHEPAHMRPAAAVHAPLSSAAGGDKGVSAAPAKANARVLTVGNDILLKGEIATCDRVVIEGRVEAKLSDVHTVEIAGSGSFKGTAEVEEAEISGLFEGDLIVRSRLVIYASGEVRGNITYGEIEIERGGRLTGQIRTVESLSALQDKPNLLDVLEGNKPRGKKESEAA